MKSDRGKDYQDYLSFFEEVYRTMEENYYFSVSRDSYEHFLKMFDAKIYPQLKQSRKSNDYIKWRSSAYLVDYLKDQEDIFSAFFPPQAAEEYEKEVLGKRIDLGLEGVMTPDGFRLYQVEPRSDAYEKGLRPKDYILRIDQKPIQGMPEEEIRELLNPLEGSLVEIQFREDVSQTEKTVSLESREYFKQTVFLVPVNVPGVYCLQIKRFNRKTSEDLTLFMSYILKQGGQDLILDLRGNPGGPPLAAREISAFFLPPREEFAYFQRKDKPRAVLDVPLIPGQFHYHGNIVILVNKESGSASELFSGILQSKGRAEIMGTNTAGQVFLKSMFNFEDESMVLLVTARGFHPDGSVFSFQGIDPDQKFSGEVDLVQIAAEYLFAKRQKPNPIEGESP
ncbi:MAG: S41 family peptidase [Candidatus Omnitrophota bacterium]